MSAAPDHPTPALPAEKQSELGQRFLAIQDAARDRAIAKRDWTGPAPLSFAQERLWFLNRLLPGTPLYSMPAAFDLEGSLDSAAFRRAMNLLVERHATLRTIYCCSDGEPSQSVEPGMTADFAFLDAAGIDDSDLDRTIRREAARPFELTRDAILRVRVYRGGPLRHTLFLNMPHIAGDAWSYTVLFLELGHLYGALRGGRDCSLPPLPIEYRDFAAWQRDWLQGEALERGLAYWKQQLRGADRFEPPLDQPRPASLVWRGASEQVIVPAAVSSLLPDLIRDHSATPFMGWLAGCFLLLHKWTGADDLLVGTPSANRSRLEFEGMVGLFVNTLLLRAKLSAGLTFAGLLDLVRDKTIESQQNQEIPFEQIVAALEPAREWNREPFLRVMFSYGAKGSALSLPGLVVKPRDIETGTAKFDLHLHVQGGPGKPRIYAQYRTDLFQRATIARLLREYASLMEMAVTSPNLGLNALEPDGEDARRKLPSSSAALTSAYPQAAVPRLFEGQVRKRPDAVAVSMRSVRVSYADLDSRSNRLAHRLVALGAASETCVGLMLPRSVEAILAMLGILKSGAAYVPLDPAWPAERLNLLVADSGMRCMVTFRHYAAQVPAGVVPVWADDFAGAGDESGPDVVIAPDTLACVLYTSGSTGKPKGVQVLHRGIVRLLFGVDYATFGPGEVLLNAAPLTFDAATFEIWGALLHGGCCAIFPEGPFSPRNFGAALREHGVTTLWLTSSLFNLLIDEAPEVLAGVRQLLTGGEALSVAHVRRALERLPGAVLVNGYGPTEGTTFTCCYRIPREMPRGLASIPIGRPIANTEVYILDERGEPVPAGAAGELYIGGDGVARGYANREDLTRERFLLNRFTRRGKLYRSGDLARILPDGNLEFLGRLDDQVKIHGFRIEPGEVEAALLACPAVRSAAVIATELAPGERCLEAYVVANRNPATALVSDLHQFLQARLPAYMIPARIIAVERIPLTPNGKVDRAALLVFEPPATTRVSAPADEVERRLAAIWQNVLRQDCPDVDEDFFTAGGDSLKLVRVADRVEKAFGREVSLAALIQEPTIRAMAVLVRDHSVREPGGFLVPIQTGGSKPPLFGVHDVRGQVLLFAALSTHFGPEQPVYGLQPRGIAPGQGPFITIEELAAQYVREVRSVQPAGPYRLAGPCFGGVVAFEMARQLESAGERVDFLALIDAFASAPIDTPGAGAVLHHMGRRLALNARLLARQNGARMPSYFLERGQTVKRRISYRFWVWRRRLFRAGRLLEPDAFEPAGYYAIKSYRPGLYGGGAVLFRARERSPLDQDPKAGWARVIRGQIDVCEIPGDHLEMLSHPNRSILALELARRLDSADGDALLRSAASAPAGPAVHDRKATA
jgi:amino acid adenylation domain-containing protein